MRLVVRLARGAFLLTGGSLAACAADVTDGPMAFERGAASSATTAVCWNDVRQVITGFGASSAWTAPDISDELADEMFSIERVGLSLLRVRITPSGTTSETRTARKAQARGAAVWAAPWSPPGAWKTNGTDNDGGSLLPEHYAAWAERLALFVRSQEDEGVHVSALSAQNEPDYRAEWETCLWQPEELTRFVRDHLAPALAAEGLAPRLLAPESAGWGSIARYGEAILSDPGARDAIEIIATHSYNGVPYDYPSPAAHGKEFWMTEWSDDETVGADAGMTSGLVVARVLHETLTIAEVNAWHYWWLVDREDVDTGGNGALIDNGVITRRAYVMGQFSRFARPGSRRLRVSSPSPQGNVFVSAFTSPVGELVLVAVNGNEAPVSQSFVFEGAEVGELVPWVTDDEVTIESGAPVPGGSELSVELGPRSVTTWVGPFSRRSDASPHADCSRLDPQEQSTATGCSCRLAGARSARSEHGAWFVVILFAYAWRRRSLTARS